VNIGHVSDVGLAVIGPEGFVNVFALVDEIEHEGVGLARRLLGVQRSLEEPGRGRGRYGREILRQAGEEKMVPPTPQDLANAA
jgi:hypothetical protein